jgi:group I intron endonuclease
MVDLLSYQVKEAIMAHIYKITNLVNQKIYIGKTNYEHIQDRWYEHLKDFCKPTEEKRPLYKAMQKYGVKNFVIELIETVETDEIACEREKFWIEYYRSYVGFPDCNGYNATLGGDGKSYISEQEKQEICQYYLSIGQVKKTAQYFSHSEDTISKILREHNIKVNYIQHNDIEMRDLKTKELIKTFVNQCEAGRWLQEQGLTSSDNVRGISYIIGRAVKGERKSAYGYAWNKKSEI